MSKCNPTHEKRIPYFADLHEHLIGKSGKTHRYLESKSCAVITFSKTSTSSCLLFFIFSINFELNLSLPFSVSLPPTQRKRDNISMIYRSNIST